MGWAADGIQRYLGASRTYVHQEGALAVIAGRGDEANVGAAEAVRPKGVVEKATDEEAVIHAFLDMLSKAIEGGSMSTVENLGSLGRLSGELTWDKTTNVGLQGSIDEQELKVALRYHRQDEVATGQLESLN